MIHDEPLTLDQLRAIDGYPVWITFLGPWASWPGGYAIMFRHTDEFFWSREHCGGCMMLRADEYGQTWAAHLWEPDPDPERDKWRYSFGEYSLDELHELGTSPLYLRFWGEDSGDGGCYAITFGCSSEFLFTHECGPMLLDLYGVEWVAYRRDPDLERAAR